MRNVIPDDIAVHTHHSEDLKPLISVGFELLTAFNTSTSTEERIALIFRTKIKPSKKSTVQTASRVQLSASLC
jgi:hypothetical protein